MITTVLVVGILIACVIARLIAFFRAGIAREEADRSLLGEPATRASAVTRRVVGLYVRTPRYVIPANHTDVPNDETDSEYTANHT